MNTKSNNMLLTSLALTAVASASGQPTVPPNPVAHKGSYRGAHGAKKRVRNRRRNKIARATRKKNR